jgi:hypothetical protein
MYSPLYDTLSPKMAKSYSEVAKIPTETRIEDVNVHQEYAEHIAFPTLYTKM